MDDLCVHCGQPIDYVHLLIPHGEMWLHRRGGRLCADGSGHHARPTQAGVGMTYCQSTFRGAPCHQPGAHVGNHTHQHTSGHAVVWTDDAADHADKPT